jgi:Helix-turn-helix domain
MLVWGGVVNVDQLNVVTVTKVTGMLDSEQAALRLGVKLPTLYAYVSRRLVESHHSGEGRRRLFAADDVEDLAKRSRGNRAIEAKVATVSTGVTQIRDHGPVYRGRLARDECPRQPTTSGARWSGHDDQAGHLLSVAQPGVDAPYHSTSFNVGDAPIAPGWTDMKSVLVVDLLPDRDVRPAVAGKW